MGKTILKPELTETGLPVYSAGATSEPWGFIEGCEVRYGTETLVISARGNIGMPKRPRQVPFVCTQTTIACSAYEPEVIGWIYWFLTQFDYSKKSSQTTIPMLRTSDVDSFEIPLPPLAEQKRIVSKIEELFSELDAGEESLRRARRQLGVYRQSLLKQAFEGKLTAPWRKQNPHLLESFAADDEISADELGTFAELPASWRYTRLGRFIQHIDAGKSFRCEERRPKPNEIGVAKVSAVTWGEYDEVESKTCIDPAKVNPSYFIREGDFLLSRANTIELVGACVLVRRVTQPIMLSDKTLRLSIDDERKSFILQYLRSHQGRREIEKRSTGNQESMRNIGQERIRSIVIPECTLPEQREIVRLLDEQFTVIEQNEREIDAALKRSAALRQSILKKAFTGQLVPQDPTDEPASALLERIRKERVATPSTTSRRTKIRK
jgi:type I restriction enzyme S subunit